MERYLRISAVVVAALAILLSFGPNAAAQSSNGIIAGVVTDKSGAAIPDASVEVVSSDRGGEPRSTTTDSAGAYRVEALLPGKYVVSIKKVGFSELKVSAVDVKASLTSTVSGTLDVAAQASTILVEATSAQELQTQSGELSANLTATEIHELPINSLNPISLVMTQAGVQDGNGRGISNGVNFSVNGNRPRANNFLIDGQDNNDNAIAGQAFQPTNLEAISEVTILTNAYGAEYGRGGGSVTNVIYKGGTNTFHGSAWELATNSALATAKHENTFADCAADDSCYPVQIENTFGFSIGGPIKRDKLFVFGSSQWDRFRSTNNGNTLLAPTADGVTALQALGSANANFLLAAFNGLTATNASRSVALGSNGGPDRGVINFGPVQRSGIAEVQNDRQWDVRVDFNATDKDTLFARYFRDDFALTPDLFNFPNQLQPFDSEQGGPSQSFAGGWTHTLSSKVVNEFRASYTNIGFTFGPTAATTSNPLAAGPAITIAGITSGFPFPTLGFPSNLPQGRAHKTYQYQDVLSYTVGRHTFRGGADITHLAVVDSIPFNSRGTISFQASTVAGSCGAIACTGLADFVDNFTGSSGSVSKVFGNPVLQPFTTSYAPYIQDTWRVKENLTLTLGVRYEYWGTPENVLNFPAIDPSLQFGLAGITFPQSYSFKQPSDRNNFGPRIGFAWTPKFGHLVADGKTVIRGGYGIFYDGLFTNILDNTGGTSPNAVGGTLTGTAAQNGGRGLANATGLLNSVTSTLNPLATVNSIAGNLVNPETHQWNLDIQREFGLGFVFTAAYVGTRGEHLFVNQQYNPGINSVRMNPTFGSVTVRTNGADSIYHGGQFTLDRRFNKGLLLRAAYTYSKLIDDASEVFTISNQTANSQNTFDQGGDRGPSLYDRRQRLVLTYVWDLPGVHRSGAGWNVAKAITNGWEWAGIATFQSGIPETIISGTDRNGDLIPGNDRPDIVDPSLPVGDFNRYAPAALGTNGNLGRNTYFGPNEWFWDMAVVRKIPLFRERHVLTLRAEFINAFNHANDGLPSLNLNAGPSDAPGDGGFGDLKSTITGQRQIKIYLKYSF